MIKASVGRGGLNKAPDVKTVQLLLNEYLKKHKLPLAQLKADGLSGRKTIAAIVQFQSHIVGMALPDGRVDAGGKSIRTLEKYNPKNPQKQSTPATTTPIVVATPKSNSIAGTIVAAATPITDPRQLKTRADIAAAYGAISTDKKWARRSEFLAKFAVPAKIANDPSFNWINVYDPKKRKVTSVWCHKAMHHFLETALNNLQTRGLLVDLKEYGGCHAIRATWGTLNWSAHSWALAIDINMTGNGLGQTPKMSAEFAKCFTDAGFGWGGNYSRKDGMHFTIAGFDMPGKK